MLVYAELGIPEVWRYDGRRLMFSRLGNDGRYQVTDHSLAFPLLSSGGLESFIHRRGSIGELALEDELRQWVRTVLAAH